MATAALLTAMPAAAETGFLKITGAKQGLVKGEVTQKGREDSLAVLDLGWGISMPSTASGLAIGRRSQQPVTIALRWSKATPLLLNAAETNEVLTSVVYSGYVPNADGTESVHHTLTLTNARITSISIADRKPDSDVLDPAVNITLSYQKLTMTETDGGITAQDDWMQAQ